MSSLSKNWYSNKIIPLSWRGFKRSARGDTVPIPTLPLEIMELVFEETMKDGIYRGCTLSKFALVSQHFRTLAQRAMFQVVNILDLSPGVRLLHLLKRNPVLISYVKLLRIFFRCSQWGRCDKEGADRCLHLSELLPKILKIFARHGNLERLSFLVYGAWSPTCDTIYDKRDRNSVAGINMRTGALDANPLALRLRLHAIHLLRRLSVPYLLHPDDRFPLKFLVLDFYRAPPILEYLIERCCPFSLKQLKHLFMECWSFDVYDLQILNKLPDACTSLKYFIFTHPNVLTFYDQSVETLDLSSFRELVDICFIMHPLEKSYHRLVRYFLSWITKIILPSNVKSLTVCSVWNGQGKVDEVIEILDSLDRFLVHLARRYSNISKVYLYINSQEGMSKPVFLDFISHHLGRIKETRMLKIVIVDNSRRYYIPPLDMNVNADTMRDLISGRDERATYDQRFINSCYTTSLK